MWTAKSSLGDGVVKVDLNASARWTYDGGTYEVIMGKTALNGLNINTLDLKLPLGAYAGQNLTLSFWLRDINENTDPQDGVWISDDGGKTFKKILSFDCQNWYNPYSQLPPLDLDELTRRAGLRFTDDYVLRFQQAGADAFTSFTLLRALRSPAHRAARQRSASLQHHHCAGVVRRDASPRARP